MSIIQTAKQSVISTTKPTIDWLDGQANKWIVKPKNAEGINGFLFDYEGETQINLQAEITDHYSEKNEVLNDHVALRPLKMTLRGFVADLVLKQPSGLLAIPQTLQDKLTTVPAYLGKYTPGGIKKIQQALTQTTNIINTIEQSVARVQNVVKMFPGVSPAVTNQEKAYAQLVSFFTSRTEMTVVTPYGGVATNMYIENLSFIQDETTRSWSDISVTLKQLRFVDMAQATVDKNLNRRSQQTQPTKDKGRTIGKSLPAAAFDALKASFN